MVALALVAQNCASGLTFGVYGTTIVAMETQYGISRAVASSCISIMVLVMGLLSPLVGELLQRASVRSVLVSGALYCALGYGGLLLANNIYVVMAIYALVLGPAYCLLGPVPASTLVSKWFQKDRGRALGIVNMPLGLFIVPPLSAAIVDQYGMQGAFIAAMVVSLAVIPLLLSVISQPSDIGQAPLGGGQSAPNESAPALAAAEPLSAKAILREPTFWVIMFGCCIFTGAAMMIATHIVPLAQHRGFGLEKAAMLLSAFGICGAIGAPVWGWLADKLGPSRAYVVAAAVQLVLWVGLFYTSSNFVLMLIVAGLIGFSSGGSTVPLVAASFAEWLGSASFSRALGMSYFFKLPFLVGAPIMAGLLHDWTGDYQAAMLVFIVSLPIVAVLFAFHPISKRRSGQDA